MTRYFLHIRNGDDLVEDLEGQEFPNLEAAKWEAAQAARDVMAECLRAAQPMALHRSMVIASCEGKELAVIPFRLALLANEEDRSKAEL